MVSVIISLFNNVQSYYKSFIFDRSHLTDLILNPNLNMTEIVQNTDDIINNDSKLYSAMLQYMAGNCWLNGKLSRGKKLEGKDKEIYDGVNKLAHSVKPLSYSISLFHGFEYNTDYNEHAWYIGKNISIPGFLSKTPSFQVANKFASSRGYLDYYNRKFLVVQYPKGSRHIGADIRHPTDPEYEYLTFSGEQLQLINIHRILSFPIIMTFYVCKSLDY